MCLCFADSCGLHLKAITISSNISSPGYPLQYRSNLTCNWIITAPTANHVIEIRTGFVSNQTCCERLQVNVFFYHIFVNFNNESV